MKSTRFIGKICDRHPELGGERMICNTRCVACKNESTKKWKQRNPGKIKEAQASREHKGGSYYERRLEINRQWRAANKDKVAAINKRGYEADKPNRIAYAKNAWTERNHLIQSQGVSKFYRRELIAIYKNCPPGHHVDHEIPLRGKMVSGLHIPRNLQYLPSKVNLSKGNSFKENQQ